ncbi:protein kinase, putative [Acanthamoeba castellanii str. Neff]|uniref:non-specific serine/threonine protein kinase n=1 Tax=Acanthamoeba castellanii (strain ATCC 30010 / Neff) TaxID=1257118 RepID=L8HD69_ACACF|nr:protein kinase, putative [Acanthamoeba castellanii str. Neff]ELR23177.1 protein kinase, putative [Acanthamoeba castellanii str. Neff]
MGFGADCSSVTPSRSTSPSTSPRTSLDFTSASEDRSSGDWTQNDDIFSLGDYLICTRHLLGRGSFGEVKLGFHRPTGRRVAVKIINKAQLSPEKRQEVDREIEILKKVGIHPCIVSLHDVAEDESFIYMFFEYVASDLLRFLKQHGRLDEPVVYRIFSQLVEAVSYLHANGIVHRDIKIENILIDEASLSVKLCDFGFATYYTPTTRFEKWCGSPHTVAPEIIQRIPYSGPKVDVWSLGSVLYTMICAFFPFQATVPKDVLKRTVLGKFHAFPGGCGSRATHDLISRCLTIDTEKRITLDHVRQHPFFWKHEKIGAEAVTVEENESGEEGTVEWSDSMDVMTC